HQSTPVHALSLNTAPSTVSTRSRLKRFVPTINSAVRASVESGWTTSGISLETDRSGVKQRRRANPRSRLFEKSSHDRACDHAVAHPLGAAGRRHRNNQARGG